MSANQHLYQGTYSCSMKLSMDWLLFLWVHII